MNPFYNQFFAFINFKTQEQAMSAVKNINQKVIDGKFLIASLKE